MSDIETRMPLTEHLRELRKRLVISVIAIAIGFGIAYNFSAELYTVLTRPLIPALPPGQDYLVFSGIVEPFFIYLKVGFVGGVILASPVVLYQVWAFVAPALYNEEKRWFISIVIFSLVLFISGALFAYFVVFPFGFKYLLGYSSSELRPLLSMGEYFSMVTKLLLAFGVVFQLPLAILVLARLGIVTAGQLLRWWRYAIVIILIVSAILTPTPDVFNQLLMAGPLAFLYCVGIIVAKLFGKKKKAPLQEPETEDKEE
ncbi:MAG: twin-arginine translocase subunit TatC [Deltaproteobacteria bacterium]|nr:twin-arginine translocase subunit TatC [Deltaproteobacteria bacterium]